MDIQPMRELVNQRIQWIKEKGYWLLLAALAASTFFFTAFFLTGFTMFILQPQDYRAEAFPEFQAKQTDDYKLVAILENSELKQQLCTMEEYAYTGKSVSQEQYCIFNYQQLPPMRRQFDVVIRGLNPLQVRYVTVCLLKFPRNSQQQRMNPEQYITFHPKPSSGEPQDTTTFNLRNRYVCQKYRAYNKIHIVKDMQTDELIFMELQLQLTAKGYETFQLLNIKLQFEEDRSNTIRFFIDHYLLFSGLLSFGVASWAGVVTFILGLGFIVHATLRQKQERQQEMINRANRKKRQ